MDEFERLDSKIDGPEDYLWYWEDECEILDLPINLNLSIEERPRNGFNRFPYWVRKEEEFFHECSAGERNTASRLVKSESDQQTAALFILACVQMLTYEPINIWRGFPYMFCRHLKGTLRDIKGEQYAYHHRSSQTLPIQIEQAEICPPQERNHPYFGNTIRAMVKHCALVCSYWKIIKPV